MSSGAAETGVDLKVPSTTDSATRLTSCTKIKPPWGDEGPKATSSLASCFKITTGTDNRYFTTVMLRNIPDHYTSSKLLSLLTHFKLDRKYDFAYLPHKYDQLKSKRILHGYAVVNMIDHDSTMTLIHKFTGFKDWDLQGTTESDQTLKGGSCRWYNIQGRDALICRYQHSNILLDAVVDERVVDERMPMLFHDDGQGLQRIPKFPPRELSNVAGWKWDNPSREWYWTFMIRDMDKQLPKQKA